MIELALHRSVSLVPAALLERLKAARLDLVLIAGLTVAATVPRVVFLGEIPPGLHGDEAGFGLEARRILETGNIGAFTGIATGTPTGTFYWTAAVFWLFGDSEFTLRLSYALLGILTIPLAYLAFQVMFGRSVAVIGAFLLAVSAWHLHFSRVAHVPIAWPFVEVGAMLALFLALRHESRLLFGLAGALVGFGIYTYGGYPTFALAVGVFLVWLGAVHYRQRLLPLASWVGVMLGMALLAGLPMASYARDHPDQYTYRLEAYSVTKSAEYEAAGNLFERGRLIADREVDFIRSLITEPVFDYVDAAGVFPPVNRVMVGLLVVGGVFALWRWRSPAQAFLIIGVVVIALGPAVTLEAGYRRSLGLTPLIAALGALPLAFVWDNGRRWGRAGLAGAAAAVVVTAGAVGAVDLHRYFTTYGDDELVRWVYVDDLAEAARYLDDLPDETYVYFFNERHSINYETRLFIAPGLQGEDRSREFGRFDLTVDRSRDVALVFMGSYVGELEEARRLYPGGRHFTAVDEATGAVIFAVYLLSEGEGGALPPAPAAPTAPAAPGGAERDAARQQDLVAIQGALEQYRLEHDGYPDTAGGIQTLCAFPDFDAGCALREVLSPLPQDPLGDPTLDGYWYASDGGSYSLYAQRESDQLPACSEHPAHLGSFSSLLCVRGP